MVYVHPRITFYRMILRLLILKSCARAFVVVGQPEDHLQRLFCHRFGQFLCMIAEGCKAEKAIHSNKRNDKPEPTPALSKIQATCSIISIILLVHVRVALVSQ